MEYLDCDKELIKSVIDDLRKKNKDLEKQIEELKSKETKEKK